MKIAISSKKSSFGSRWISYLEENSIQYKLVNCFDSDIILQLKDCDGFMWHFYHASPQDVKFAKQLIYSLQAAGKKVFPDFNTMWHFDDKVGQKYLLEALNAPIIPTYVFYSKKDAIAWVKQTSFPKVFKLRGGAGSANVRLVKTQKEASRLISKAFRHGFNQNDPWRGFKERWRKYRRGNARISDLAKGIARFFIPTRYDRLVGKEAGYIYFQDFIPNNDSDIRVIVIGNKAFAIKRMVRENDFRASGSGSILYEKELFDESTIRLAFNISNTLKTQCIAFDFVYHDNKPLIVEISYGFSPEGYDSCPGYWDSELNWHNCKFNPYGWMVDLIRN